MSRGVSGTAITVRRADARAKAAISAIMVLYRR